MAENTRIQWAHHTFNPWRGCQKVAAGCANCYAEAQSKRNHGTLGIWGPDGTRVVASESMWRQPLKWNRPCPRCKGDGCEPDDSDDMTLDPVHWMGPAPCSLCNAERPRVFCASLADVFEDWGRTVVLSDGSAVCLCGCCTGFKRFFHGYQSSSKYGSSIPPKCECGSVNCRQVTLDDVRARLFALIDDTQSLDWLLLTKRIENARRMWPKIAGILPLRENVWLGCSVSCQEDADRNIPELLKVRDLAAKLFVSVEPLVGPVNLGPWLEAIVGQDHHPQCHGECSACPVPVYGSELDWVIVGGESGPDARLCDVDWIHSIVGQCKAAGVPVFVKQLGANSNYWLNDGVSRPLHDPKGGDPSEWPESLRVRQVP